ncbi:MAG: hypothetical protein K2J07_07165 [Muribaculaceae bacterium]|nr:hypothetical protein [Muribaculaceae bacterium]MDE6832493.1 hypothetical protein [Muribaculaceae bacterium]
MSNKGHDIDDDEIRIISSQSARQAYKPVNAARKRKPLWSVIGMACVVIVAVAIFFLIKGCGASQQVEEAEYPSVVESPPAELLTDTVASQRENEVVTEAIQPKGHIEMCDTTIAGARLTVYTPVGATPELAIGIDLLADTTVLMAFQAADVRADNGQIVSAFVEHGRLISTGQSKAGFCAIIDGKITLGVADVTQYFEQALNSGGYFFRQYPLVVGNQVVENKPKGRSLRKALAELNGRVVIVVSRNELTFGEFSNAMVDMGVTTAIYLVGSRSYGIVRLSDDDVVEYNLNAGKKYPEYTNFIVWK